MTGLRAATRTPNDLGLLHILAMRGSGRSRAQPALPDQAFCEQASPHLYEPLHLKRRRRLVRRQMQVELCPLRHSVAPILDIVALRTVQIGYQPRAAAAAPAARTLSTVPSCMQANSASF